MTDKMTFAPSKTVLREQLARLRANRTWLSEDVLPAYRAGLLTSDDFEENPEKNLRRVEQKIATLEALL